MIPASTLNLLKALKENELERFGEFVVSPYFNSIGKLTDLFEIFAKYYPEFDPAKLDDRKIFKKLYPSKEFKEKTIKNLYSEFSKLLRKFLTVEEVFKDTVMIELKLAKALSLKNAYESSDKVISDNMQKLNFTELGIDYYMDIFRLESQKYFNLFREDKKFDLQDIYNRLQFELENLTGYFFARFSNTAFNMLFSAQTQTIDPGNPKLINFINSIDTEKLMDFLDSTGIKNPEIVKIYHLFLYHLLNEFTEKDYYKLKKMLIDSVPVCSKTELVQFWGDMLNLVILKLVPTDKKFYKELVELSKFYSKLNIYPDENFENFPLSMFRNIIFSGIFVEDYNWTEQFLLEYSQFLDQEKREDEISYNMGILYLNYKKFDESISYFSKVSTTDIYQNINIKFYLLANYIKLGYFDTAESNLRAIRQFYNTNKEIPQIVKPWMKDSLSYFGEIIRCHQTKRPLNHSLYKKANSVDKFFMKKYILQLMEELLP